MRSFWTTADLRRYGKTEREIRRAVEFGALIAVRKGHFAVPDTEDVLLRCARIGGVSTAITAADHLGIWTPPDPVPGATMHDPLDPRPADRLHVAVGRKDRLHDPDDPRLAFVDRPDVVIHRVEPERIATARRFGVAPLLVLLEHCFRSLPPDHALAVLESALHERHLRATEVAALAAVLPPSFAPILAMARADPESGLETIVRYLLVVLGLRFEVLAGLRGVGTVDLLVEGRLIVELDGRRYPSTAEAFGNDRRRDLASTAQRYQTLRLTWYQVFFRRSEVERAILAAVR